MKLEDAIKQETFKSPQQKAALNLTYTYNWLNGLQEDFFSKYDLTPQQYNVLRILRGCFPESACAGEIKEVMLDKNPDLTRLCDRLVRKGLVERQLNENNRRQILTVITQAGLDLLAQMEPGMCEMARYFSKLNDDEAENLSNLLDKLRD